MILQESDRCTGGTLEVGATSLCDVGNGRCSKAKPLTARNRVFVTTQAGSLLAETGWKPVLRRPRFSAFTLIELLVVLAIIGVIATFAVPAMTGIMGGSNLAQGTDLVVSQLKYANQLALSKNRSVEVRFYNYKDPSLSGSSDIRALQLWQLNPEDGTKTAIGKVQKFPGTIIISSSNLMVSGTSLTQIGGDVPSNTLPAKEITQSLPTGYRYVSFQFRPDGSTSLTSAQSYLTIQNANDQAVPPKNFATVQIEPVTSAIRVFRP